jgi:hypothetical protein
VEKVPDMVELQHVVIKVLDHVQEIKEIFVSKLVNLKTFNEWWLPLKRQRR